MFKQIQAKVLLLLGLATLPVKDGKVELSDEQKTLLNDIKDNFADKFIEQANRQLSAEQAQAETRQELERLLTENGIDFSAETTDDATADDAAADDIDDGTVASAPAPKPKADNAALIAQLRTKLKEQEEQIKALGMQDEPEPINNGIKMDTPKMKVAHSKTHLFASSKPYDSFAGRPWNQRAAGLRTEATNFTAIDFSKINQDFQDYWAENKEEILDYVRAVNRLPAFWRTISNVGDRVRYAQVIQGEVTQARKNKWLPKGKFEFQPREGKVFPIQIDKEFLGNELQDMETSWMAMFNKEGSSPYKTSFIGYMVQQILKKSFEEDQIGLVKGVFVDTKESDVPGKAIHKMSGFRKAIREARDRREYLPYDVGVPTDENIYDYVRDFIFQVPEYWRDLPNMVFYMSVDWAIKYHNKRELLKGTNQDYRGEKLTVDQFENIRIIPLHFMQGSNLMVLTTDDNVAILENIPNENANMKFQEDRRNTLLMGDYKKGIHIFAFGRQWAPGEQMNDENQMVFTNKVEDLVDVYVEQAPNATVLSGKHHFAMQTGVNTAPTAITNIADVAAGTYVYIKGNTGANPSTIANGGNFVLTADVTLDENTLITLYKNAANKFIEISRTDLAFSDFVVLAANATTANGAVANKFVTQANGGATALTNITGAVQGQVYRIDGGSDSNATTIANSGNFLLTGAMTLGLGDWITLQYNGSKFVELERFTAP